MTEKFIYILTEFCDAALTSLLLFVYVKQYNPWLEATAKYKPHFV